jgi:dTDP-glucose 4,6-dehydratase
MKILVTGGLGFIGSNFIRYLLNKYPNYEVINIDKVTYAGNPENLTDIEGNPNYSFVKGDICNQELIDKIVKSVDGIIHFAAESHVDRSIENSSDFIKTNVEGTRILLDAALKHGKKRFHHISTDEVYGSLGDKGKFNEETPYSPRSPYSASKAASDHLVNAYYETHGLPITISNCSNNYGPYQFPEKLIPLFITNLIEKKKVPLMGNGENIRDWVHVLDHCEAIDLIYHQGKIGETYCLGGNCEKTNFEITKQILVNFSVGEEMIEPIPHRKGHDFRYAVDSTKIKNELGWEPKYDFEKGMKETIEWYNNNETWWKKLKHNKNDRIKKEEIKMKGVILAGGFGTRLNPCTKVTNKHLLPIYNKPMIYYPLMTLVNAGIKDIMIVSGQGHSGHFLNLLDSGKELGVRLHYEVQEGAGGIAEALSLAERFAGKDPITVILGDNIFECNIKKYVDDFNSQGESARIFLKEVSLEDAKRFGIATVEKDKVTYVEEKPTNPKSNLAMVGLYMFDSKVFDFIRTLKRSERGELELTDAIGCYLKNDNLYYDKISGFWSDAGTFESLFKTSCFVKNKLEKDNLSH